MSNSAYMQNRELSWLRFNERVLQEAADESVPLLERFKFLAIFTSNLDEFFMVRVGSLYALAHAREHKADSRSGWTPAQQLEKIYAAVRPLYQHRERVYDMLMVQLRKENIAAVHYESLAPSELLYLRQLFDASIAPILSPQIVDLHHPFPHFQNKVLYAGAWLQYRHKREVFGIVPLPGSLPEVIFLPGSSLRFIHTQEVILQHLEEIFSNYQVLERMAFCVTRSADINPDDEAFDFGNDDFRKKMRTVLKHRRRLAPVRLELSTSISHRFESYLCDKLILSPGQIFVTQAPLKLSYVFSLPDRLTAAQKGHLLFTDFSPAPSPDIDLNQSICAQIQKHDLLLSYPYQSMQPFLQLIKEAAYDPAVLSIKITIYRLARKAKLVEYLCAAAENGKDVVVLIELRARFDEQNNIDWSEQLEEAGCTILYGFDSYKVHSKVCLIIRKERDQIQYITQIGTGNYNERTARQYTDVTLITADRRIGQDADTFFKNLAIGNLDGQYQALLVSPYGLKPALMALMDGEIAKGQAGRILIKINSITDTDLIDKLRQASRAGVQVDLIVRGICCILPGVPNETENIHIISIVGRFLEHSRIYCFGRGSACKMYISSADFMTRNTIRRVEVACPIFDQDIQAKLHTILDLCLRDNVKARIMQRDGSYRPKDDALMPLSSQQTLLEQAQFEASANKLSRVAATKKSGFHTRLLRWFRKAAAIKQ